MDAGLLEHWAALRREVGHAQWAELLRQALAGGMLTPAQVDEIVRHVEPERLAA